CSPPNLRNSAVLKRQSKHHLLDFSLTPLTAFFSAVLYHVVDLNRTVILQARSTAFGTEIIPSAEDPSQDIVERNIRIIVPLNSRENISDPTSPMRTKFVYHLSDLCKKCDTREVELEDQVVTASQSNICDRDTETCYTYDRNKCYTNRVKLNYRGQTKLVETALTPDSCYPD
uniref:Joining chain of multimeric IgA and IgM n=1 Tax=Ovis aries TaxID=9940 RepID=A0AC11EKZ2_SHEEP